MNDCERLLARCRCLRAKRTKFVHGACLRKKRRTFPRIVCIVSLFAIQPNPFERPSLHCVCSHKQINYNDCTGGVHTGLASCCVVGTIGGDHTMAIGYVADTTDCVAIAIWTDGSFASATDDSCASGCEARDRAGAFPRKFCDCSSRWRQTRCCRTCCGRPDG